MNAALADVTTDRRLSSARRRWTARAPAVLLGVDPTVVSPAAIWAKQSRSRVALVALKTMDGFSSRSLACSSRTLTGSRCRTIYFEPYTLNQRRYLAFSNRGIWYA